MTTWFASDHHFSHWSSAERNIIKYCNRPFSTIKEMDSALLDVWNKTVFPDDIVYYLGDLTLGDNGLSIIKQLNGWLRIVSPDWHHDRRWLITQYHTTSDGRSVWDILERPPVYLGAEHVVQIDSMWFHMAHYPLARWDRQHYGSYHLHAHSHNNYSPEQGLILDVGIDSAKEKLGEYRPFSLDEVVEFMNSRQLDRGCC